MINNVEEWRDVGGYEGLYKISNRGRIKSYQGRYKKPKILKTTMTTTGYKKIELTKNKRKKSLKVHRLVAEAFLPNEENKPYVNHIDNNPLNNDVKFRVVHTKRKYGPFGYIRKSQKLRLGK